MTIIACGPGDKVSSDSDSATSASAKRDSVMTASGRAEGELEHPVSWYVANKAGQQFWSTHEPLSKPPKFPLQGWGGWRTRLGRECESATNEECVARGRAHGVAVKYPLNRVPDDGIIAGFFQLTSGGAAEKKYKMQKGMRGYFLVITKASTPTEGEGRWQLVGIDKEYNITVFPSVDTFGRYVRCDAQHNPTHTAAGFESCEAKHRAMMRFTSGDSGLVALNLFEAALTDPELEVINKGSRDELMWTTCHLGCCRAYL